MEKAPARPRAEKPNLVPLKDDIDACLNVLSREHDALLRANSDLGDRATAALEPLARREKSEYAQKVGEGRLAPLTHEAMEENERRIDDLDDLKEDLQGGMEAISAGRLPDAAFLKALREAWHVDRRQIDDDLRRLQVLRRRHVEGEPLSEQEYAWMNRAPQKIAEANERLTRMRNRISDFKGVRRLEEAELGFTPEGKLVHRERIDRESERLMSKPENLSPADELEPDHRVSNVVRKSGKRHAA